MSASSQFSTGKELVSWANYMKLWNLSQQGLVQDLTVWGDPRAWVLGLYWHIFLKVMHCKRGTCTCNPCSNTSYGTKIVQMYPPTLEFSKSCCLHTHLRLTLLAGSRTETWSSKKADPMPSIRPLSPLSTEKLAVDNSGSKVRTPKNSTMSLTLRSASWPS